MGVTGAYLNNRHHMGPQTAVSNVGRFSSQLEDFSSFAQNFEWVFCGYRFLRINDGARRNSDVTKGVAYF